MLNQQKKKCAATRRPMQSSISTQLQPALVAASLYSGSPVEAMYVTHCITPPDTRRKQKFRNVPLACARAFVRHSSHENELKAVIFSSTFICTIPPEHCFLIE